MKHLTRTDILQFSFQQYTKTGITIALPLLVGGTIPTLEGEKKAYTGDYLCIGVEGEIWPVRKAHFEAEKRMVTKLPNGLAAYESTSVRHAIRIDEQFCILKDSGLIAFTSEPEGGYLVWNGKTDPQAFKAWIVKHSIFEASHTPLQGSAA